MDWAVLLVFVPTFFLVSISPGMCMTLALSLGVSIGVRRSLWMMAGEVLGVISIATLAVLGVAKLLLSWPLAFVAMKIIGGLYLFWVGCQLLGSKGKLSFGEGSNQSSAPRALFLQGLLTACANPKAWAFNVAILPPFINFEASVTLQLAVMLGVIACTEFICMLIYATGGRSLRHLLVQDDGAKWLNRVSGSLMILVAVWLWFS